MNSLLVPIHGEHGEAVEIRLDELADDPEDQCSILQAELASLDLWLCFAMAYYSRGMYEQFVTILNKTQTEEAEEAYKDANVEDKLNILLVLAMYYGEMEAAETDGILKEEYFRHATHLYNKGMDIHPHSAWLHAGKGTLCMQRNDYVSAKNHFDASLFYDNECVPAILGSGCCAYREGKYREALAFYQKALMLSPTENPTKRLGLGLCFLQLKQYELAEAAFKRVLEYDENNVEALCCLAVLCANNGGQLNEGNVEQSLKFLERAYGESPNDPNVLNLLCNYFFYRIEFDTVRQLSERVKSMNAGNSIKAESAFQNARTWHVEEEYDRAFNSYTQALKLDANHVLSSFGLGQILVQRGKLDEAIKCFEMVLKTRSDNMPLYRILGSLYVKSGLMGKAREILRSGTKSFSSSIDLWIEYADTMRLSNTSEALAAYSKAVQLCRDTKRQIPPQTWNNIGCLYLCLGKIEDALKAFVRALGTKNCAVLRVVKLHDDGVQRDTNDTSDAIPFRHLTMAYNVGRLLEKDGRLDRAIDLYTAVLVDHKQYTECYARMSRIEEERGQFEKAEEWLRRALSVKPECVDSWSRLGHYLNRRKKLKDAVKCFQHLLTIRSTDPEALIALGNLTLEQALPLKNDARVYGQQVVKALEYFKTANEHDSRNMDAVNGVAICFQKMGFRNEARDLYLQLKDASAEYPNVWINLAIMHMEDEKYGEAIKMYEHVVHKFPAQVTPSLEVWLSRAFYMKGDYLSAKRVLSSVLHKHPEDKVLWYNLALCLEEYGVQVMRRTERERTFADVSRAYHGLNNAVSMFGALAKETEVLTSDICNSSVHPKKAEKHQKFCANCVDQSKPHLEHAESQKEYARRVQERSVEAHKAAQRAIQEKQEAKRKREEEERQRLAKLAEEDRERLAVLHSQWQQKKEEQAEAAESSSKKKKRKKDDDDFIDNDGALPPLEEEDEPEQNRDDALAELAARRKRDATDNDDAEESEQPQKKKRLIQIEDDEEEEEEEEGDQQEQDKQEGEDKEAPPSPPPSPPQNEITDNA